MPYVYKHRRPPEPWREYVSGRPRFILPILVVEYFCEWGAFVLSRSAILEMLEYAGSLSILVGVIFYFAGARSRLEQKHYQAWQVINTANGTTGNGGRIDALQDLNGDGVPLVNVDVNNAYLQNVQLPGAKLNRGFFSRADMRGANLMNADLSESVMHFTNLRGADLSHANLDSVDFEDADLGGANLEGIVNWQTIASVKRTNVGGVKNAPAGFVDWAKKNGADEEP
jgi:pentapeptide repeat protein